ncbi:hypothetical protein OH807_12355 [Kitasatospora sp. NBC_01560]|uniref:hypothetical protein n=1 Tax=Kitasatospora sp. NBC_01560 TaxID=2975965 RepID=UPI003863CB77
MATSSGAGPSVGRRVWGYVESTRNLVGCGAGLGGLGLHAAGLGGDWWPGIVAALYGAAVLLWPRGPVRAADPAGVTGPAEAGGTAAGAAEAGSTAGAAGPVGTPAGPSGAGRAAAWPELAELTAYLHGVPVPGPAKLDALLERLAEVGRQPAAELIVARRLPVAVDGYLRARTWERWAAGAPDPGAELAHEVELMAAALAA